MEHEADKVETEQNGTGNELGEVQPCDCGGVNLSMGPLTLHFAPDEVPHLYDLAVMALEMVGEKGTSRHTDGRGPARSKPVGTVH
jgi:hypothetical protein